MGFLKKAKDVQGAKTMGMNADGTLSQDWGGPSLQGQNWTQGQALDTNNRTNSLADALAQQAAGQGPNPAMAELAQATNMNNRAAASLAASQRGINPAMAARLAANAASDANQTAAGQGAIMSANQQLGAQQQLAQVLANQQNTVQGAIANQNQGTIQQHLGVQQINANNSNAQKGLITGAIGGLVNSAGAAAGIGKYNGGVIEGEAVVEGDSPKNDTKPHMLSPGEAVIPRSAMKDPEKAHAFLDALLEKTADSEPKGYAAILKANKDLEKRLAKLEKKKA